MWLAEGGVQGGMSHGTVDGFGYFAADGQSHINDLHVTMLYLVGLEHERLTFEHHARPYHLTDVAGKVVRDIIQ